MIISLDKEVLDSQNATLYSLAQDYLQTLKEAFDSLKTSGTFIS